MIEESANQPSTITTSRWWKRVRHYAILAFVIYLLSCIALWSLQDALLFPGRASQGQRSSEIREPSADSRYELIRLTTRGGEKIVAIFGRATDENGRAMSAEASRARPTVLFYYGNGMCLADTFAEFFKLRKLGVNVLIPEYVGYGMSSGKPSEAALYDTADAAYDYLQTRGDMDGKKIIPIGWSLGAAVAIDLAHRRPVIGLATFSAFTSYANMGRELLAWFPAPIAWLTKYKFESIEKVRTIDVPIFIAHGSHDRIIPNRMSKQLADAAKKSPRVTAVSVNTDHNDIFEADEELYGPLREWLKSFER